MAEWFVLRVASNKEERVRKNLLARIAEEGLEAKFPAIIVPVQSVPEIHQGKRKFSKRKMYPGYLMVQMEVDEDTMSLLETIPGVSDFLGPKGKPVAMDPAEVERIMVLMNADSENPVIPKIQLEVGDKVQIKEGAFKDYTGEIREILPSKGKVKVLVSNVFNYAHVEMEMEYWQVEGFTTQESTGNEK